MGATAGFIQQWAPCTHFALLGKASSGTLPALPPHHALNFGFPDFVGGGVEVEAVAGELGS
jgi:hypothetical protein